MKMCSATIRLSEELEQQASTWICATDKKLVNLSHNVDEEHSSRMQCYMHERTLPGSLTSDYSHFEATCRD